MPAADNNYAQVQKAMNEVADGWMAAVPEGMFDYVGDLIVQMARGNAPVGETGDLKRSIEKRKVGRFTVEVVCGVPYATPVDKGHKTRSGSFVQANPFFSSAVGRYAGTALIPVARERAQKHISVVFSRYKARI